MGSNVGIISSQVKTNKVTILIQKPASDVFTFVITPPNSALWIPLIVKEEINEWPIQVGTEYTLTNSNGESFKAIVSAFKENKFIEWDSRGGIYHCRYTLTPINNNSTELEYYEWIDTGEIDKPFTTQVLTKLKSVIEKQT